MTPTPRLPGLVRRALWLGGLLLCLGLAACQSPGPRSHCPAAQHMDAQMLQGQWTVHIADEPPWTLTLGPHPEHTGSLRGELSRTLAAGVLRHAVVADLDDGEFTLEETHDGQRIAATWQGRLPAAACGREIQGHRTLGDQRSRRFVITRNP